MNTVVETIRKQGIVSIVRTTTASEARKTIVSLIEAGLSAIEVSLVAPDAFDVIRDAVASAPHGVHIGVGTVLSPDDVRRSAHVGATFVVSPILRQDVLTVAIERELVTLPGVATPTEAMQAMEWGSTLIKLFPASLWTPGVLKEMLVALPHLEAVPTGGVTLKNAGDWITAGAVALGVGGALTRASNPGEVAQQLEAVIAAARESVQLN